MPIEIKIVGRQIHNKGAQVNLKISLENDIETDEVIEIYKANNWSSAEKQARSPRCLRRHWVFSVA